MDIETFVEAEPIITFGDIGNKVYILLNGEVNVYIQKSEEKIRKEVSDLALLKLSGKYKKK